MIRNRISEDVLSTGLVISQEELEALALVLQVTEHRADVLFGRSSAAHR